MPFHNLIATLGVLAAVAAPVTIAHAQPETVPLAPAAVRPVGPDADFLVAAHQGNLAQIKIGRLAARKAASETVRDLGRRFASYHRKLDATVRKTAAGLDVRLPSTPNSEQKTLIQQHRATSGTAFDALFVGTQLEAHDRAVKLARIVLATGADPTVRRIVTSAVPVIQQHQAALTAAQREIGDAAGQ